MQTVVQRDVGVRGPEPFGRCASVDGCRCRDAQRVCLSRSECQHPADVPDAVPSLAPDARDPLGSGRGARCPEGAKGLVGSRIDVEPPRSRAGGRLVAGLLRGRGGRGQRLSRKRGDEPALRPAPEPQALAGWATPRTAPQLAGAAPGAAATATPHGTSPTGIRPITLSVLVSTTATSLDGPLAV